MLYGCVTWTTYHRYTKQLNHFHLWKIINNIRWQNKIPDTKVLERASMVRIHCVVTRAQLRCAGHVVGVDEDRIPKSVFYCELVKGHRN